MEFGLVHVYWGDGKGKTTAAMGLALRALGRGARVCVVQFLKGRDSGEIDLLRRAGAQVLRGKAGARFVSQMDEGERELTREACDKCLAEAVNSDCDLLVLDEACAALELGMVDPDLLRRAVVERPSGREVVLTGRNPAPWMMEAADYCTEMRCVRHPYEHGVTAREGIEF